MSNLDFLGNPSLLEMVAETTDPAAWLAMVLLKDMSHNLPKTQGEATDRIKALCNHAIAMARKAPLGCMIDENGVVDRICSDETSHTGFRTIVLEPREAAEATKEGA